MGEYKTIGIKQTPRLHWLRKTVYLLLAGLPVQEIREELRAFLAQEPTGRGNERSTLTRDFTISNLMRIWVEPAVCLRPLRDALLCFYQANPDQEVPIHWTMTGAAYPFWLHVAAQTGRLLALQSQVNSSQIALRLKEKYGDRPTVTRYARYVLSAFLDWGCLRRQGAKGCYAIGNRASLEDPALISLMLEGALAARPDGRAQLGLLLRSPAFFPFQMPLLNGAYLCRANGRLEAASFGSGDELLLLKAERDSEADLQAGQPRLI